MADLEDALKKLDRLTQEEARMALAEVLKISRNVDGKVQVVIDGARGVSSQSLIPSIIYVFRRQASKRRSEGNKINYSTDGKWHRRNQVFVTS